MKKLREGMWETRDKLSHLSRPGRTLRERFRISNTKAYFFPLYFLSPLSLTYHILGTTFGTVQNWSSGIPRFLEFYCIKYRKRGVLFILKKSRNDGGI